MSEDLHLFDQHIDRTRSNSIKWKKYQGRDILPMWVADSDFKVPDAISGALHRHVDHGIFGYGSAPASLTELIVERMAERYHWHIKPEWIVYLPGLVSGLNLAVRACTDSHEGVITPAPIYPKFVTAAKFAQRPLTLSPVKLQHERWLTDLEATEVPDDSKLMLFCNPLNPGGTVHTRSELNTLHRFAKKHDLIVCSDEVHCDLILDEEAHHIPFASLDEDAAQRSITLIAPSKTFNIAGLGAAMAIIPSFELRRRFNRVRAGIVPDMNVLAYTAAEAAYRDCQPWLTQQLNYLRQHRDRLMKEINAMPGLKLHPIEATYLAWIDASELPVENPHAFFEAAGVGFSPGADFGHPGFIRMNFACTTDTLTLAIDRMRHAIESIG
ncbi:PatB family C-S lyase [Photobacterium sp. CCB-ST2H9]|uniref:MalY/PatB family protein n=1 Tax=Photobacterium sp. CCB-ST2H9 TaxID=2912855 RepID=UPI002002F5AB|nr:PatB family C-S lyase [Photobacterium sp. CCB-ST2H9]UTM56345.1 PatB family C-S lyase [Photobacterium sp. CCB-ST2H9]